MRTISIFIRLCLIWFCFTTLPVILFAQNKTIDSLNEALKTGSDSLRSLTLIELASNYFGYDTVKCDRSLQKASAILSGKSWKYNWGYYFEAESQILFNRSKYTRSLLVADSALLFYRMAIQTGNENTRKQAKFQVAVVTADKGATYATMGRNDEGISYYLEGLKLYEQSGHPDKIKKIANCYNNIASLYFGIGQYKKCLEYDVKAIPFHLQGGDKEAVSFAYIFAASDFSMLQQLDSAKSYFLKAYPYVTSLNKPSVNVEYFGKTGVLYWTIKDWPNAIKNYTIAYENARQISDVYNQAAYLRAIADASYFAGLLAESERFGLKALKITEENNFIKEKIQLYNLLSLIYRKKGDYKSAYDYLKKYVGITVQTNQEELKRKVNELDVKYHSEKKEKEIIQLQKDKQIQALSISQKSIINNFLILLVVALVLIVFFGYRSFRNRQQLAKQQVELQKQRISELEKDKRLVAVDSMMKGEENERSRLAKDLHDGLGGLLSGVKFTLSNMKDNLIITPDNQAVFERSLDMLDTSIRELRRVAHNMMPEMLVKYGLDETMKDYCNSIIATQLLAVKYQSIGMGVRLDSSMEIIVYRIVQELLNNVLKHASATEVLVQLIHEKDRLSIIVEDNGKGFDTGILDTNKAAGFASIGSRVDYLKGQLEINSEQGKGTMVNIEFKT